MSEQYIAVDIGGTQVRTALCDDQGTILKRAACLTGGKENAEVVFARILNSIRQVWPVQGAVLGIGISAPGPLDPWQGIILHSPNIPAWDGFPLRQRLQEVLGVRAELNDDANLAALAEQRFGAGKGHPDLIYLTVSTGVGSGIIIQDRLLMGRDGLAAEAGHMFIREGAPIQCGCGSQACLEAWISGPSIAHQAHGHLMKRDNSLISVLVNGQLGQITAQTVFQAALQGDQLAVEIFRQAGENLGLGIANLLYIFNPDIVVIGGSVSKVGDLLLEPARQAVRQHCMPFYWERTPIVTAALADDVGLMGAYCLVARRVK